MATTESERYERTKRKERERRGLDFDLCCGANVNTARRPVAQKIRLLWRGGLSCRSPAPCRVWAEKKNFRKKKILIGHLAVSVCSSYLLHYNLPYNYSHGRYKLKTAAIRGVLKKGKGVILSPLARRTVGTSRHVCRRNPTRRAFPAKLYFYFIYALGN